MPFIGADEKLDPMKKREAWERRHRGEKLPAPKNGSNKLKKIILKACEYRPKDRYRTAQEIYDALNGLSGGVMPENRVTEKKPYVSDETISVEEDWHESGETVGKSMYDFSDGQTAGNSWGGTAETVGVYGNNISKGSQNVYAEENVSETIGIKNFKEKQKKTKELDDLHVTIPKNTEVSSQLKIRKTMFGYIWSSLFSGILAFVIMFKLIPTIKEEKVAILIILMLVLWGIPQVQYLVINAEKTFRNVKLREFKALSDWVVIMMFLAGIGGMIDFFVEKMKVPTLSGALADVLIVVLCIGWLIVSGCITLWVEKFFYKVE